MQNRSKNGTPSDTNGILVITQLQPITVVFNVAEDYLPQIQQQLRRGNRLPVDAFDRTQQKKLSSGSLLTFDNQIDTTTGTIKLKATFPNNDYVLFPNQFVNAILLVSTQRGVIQIPSAAIQRNAQEAFVYVVKPNQNIALADANFRATRAVVKESRSQYFPTVTTSPSITYSQQSAAASESNFAGGRRFTEYALPFDASWEPDLWGRIKNTVKVSASEAQATAADLQNVRLSVQAELAFDYYQLRSFDAQKELLDTTVIAFQQQLDLTRCVLRPALLLTKMSRSLKRNWKLLRHRPLMLVFSVLNSNMQLLS